MVKYFKREQRQNKQEFGLFSGTMSHDSYDRKQEPGKLVLKNVISLTLMQIMLS